VKLLLVGNHTCGNRGDAAILRGLLEGIAEYEPAAEVEVLSRFPTSSSYLLGRPVRLDPTSAVRKGLGAGLGRKLRDRLLTVSLLGRLRGGPASAWVRFPRELGEFIGEMRSYDAVIQVGGSFFVDLYGSPQYDLLICAALAERPILMLGHSLGPFEKPAFRRISQLVLPRVARIYAREAESLEHVRQARIAIEPLPGADTAWLVRPRGAELRRGLENGARTAIAVTFRELAPFDRRLGISQEAYELAFAELLDALIRDGYRIRAVSTCTGIDGYPKDDRMVALRVRARSAYPEHFEVEMRDLNDVELGQVLASCALTIGTRLHSAIISMNFGTPAIAIAYEHKSRGLLRQMGLSDLSAEVSGLLDGSLLTTVRRALSGPDALRERVEAATRAERKLARQMVFESLDYVTSTRGAALRIPPTPESFANLPI
jgi:colanic acid/amylovoran biosynthesis protein